MTTTTKLLALPTTGYRLGRHVEHDEASRAFPAAADNKPVSKLWAHAGPVLNQGNIGACTGNAMAQLINTEAWGTARAKIKGAGKWLAEADALKIYEAATVIDDVPGSYPPDDTGSSGLAVAKVAKTEGYSSSYKHAFGLDHMLSALQLHPVICGTTWTQNMFTPNSKGFLTPTGAVAGGHEYLCLGCNVDQEFFTFLNSWGASWGVNGRFYITFANYTKLLNDQGDVTVPIPVAK